MGSSFRGRRIGLALLALCLAVGVGATALTLGETWSWGVHQSVTTTARNLLTRDQSTFTKSTGGWIGVEAKLSWIPDAGNGVKGALGVSATGSSTAWAVSGSKADGGLTAAKPGHVYAASAGVKALSNKLKIQPVIAFYDSQGIGITAVFGSITSANTGSWIDAAPQAAVAPSNSAFVALAMTVIDPRPGAELYLDDAWIKETSYRAPAVAGPLHTSGNRVLDAKGNPTVLRGVVLEGLETELPTYSDVTQQAVEQAKAWGANFVRLPLGEQYWLTSNCDYLPGYESAVDQAVQWITSLGMVALLDLHTNTVDGCEPGNTHNMADEAQAPEFWSQVASHFESNRLVAFDLYNEPHDISQSTWLNGGTTTDVYVPRQAYKTAGMQQLYDAVRATGATNLVFISGDDWANSPPTQLVNGANIVYAAHYYTCVGNDPSSCTNPNPYNPIPGLSPWVELSKTRACRGHRVWMARIR